jgi:hypothetical protein
LLSTGLILHEHYMGVNTKVDINTI